MRSKPPFRADHVGSLVRPRAIVDAHTANLEGKLPDAELRALEDQAIEELIALQERVGLQAITDGEIRRNNWRDRFFERVNGFSKEKVQSSFIFTDFAGKQYRSMPIPVVVDRLSRRQSLTAEDFGFLRKRTKRTAKATLPAPSVNHFFSGDKSLADSPYRGDRGAFFKDVCSIYRQEVADLHRLGCTYLQLDEVSIAVLCDPKNREVVLARGEDPDALIADYISAINEVTKDRPEGLIICAHLCRGNAGHGIASGGYEVVAERLFQKMGTYVFKKCCRGPPGTENRERFVAREKVDGRRWQGRLRCPLCSFPQKAEILGG